MRRGSLFVISAPSGAGKSTLIRGLTERLDHIGFSVSHTTRQPRVGESDGVHYHFVDREEFEELASRGEFVEWAEVHGNLYGTSMKELERELSSGNDVILDIDVQGAEQVAAKMPDAVLIFILPPSVAELERRLTQRGKDAEEVIQRRLENALGELAKAGSYHYAIVNEDLTHALDDLVTVAKAARLRTAVHPKLWKQGIK